MELTHRFTVPAGIEETWAAFNDIESVAGCFPGAQVTSAEEDSFEGTVKVKLGPIALVYKGSGEFTEKDESAHRMVIRAKGKDKRGNGTAGADVVATMSADGPASTDVEVVTDLNVTGKPAQFGRGVMQDVSDKLLGQFTDCLSGRLGTSAPAEEDAGGAGEPAGSSSPPAPAATPADEDRPDAQATPAPAAAAPAPAARATPAGEGRATGGGEALDLGATAVPVLLRAYGPQIAAALGGFVLLVLLLRRRKE